MWSGGSENDATLNPVPLRKYRGKGEFPIKMNATAWDSTRSWSDTITVLNSIRTQYKIRLIDILSPATAASTACQRNRVQNWVRIRPQLPDSG
jgi:hypothetical protein